MSNIETIVRLNICNSLQKPAEESGQLDMDASLVYEYGLGSLDLIMLMSAVCTEADVPLTELSEDDVAKLRTPADIVNLLTSKIPA